MSFIVSLLWICSFSGFFVILFQRRFELTVPITLILGSLILYLFGFANHVSYGYYFTWIFCGVFWMVLVYWLFYKKQEQLQSFIRNYFTLGFVVFIFLYCYIFILQKTRGFSYWDEFMHWGVMVRETIRLDGFYALPESLLPIHKDYPPFFAMLETLWCCFRKITFQEANCYRALTTFALSLFLPLLSNLNIRKWQDHMKAVVLSIVFLLTGLTIASTPTASDGAHFYNSIYVDWALAVFCAYSLFCVYKVKKWDIFSFLNISMSLSVLLLMKQMGLPFYLLVLFFLLIKLWITRKHHYLNWNSVMKIFVFFFVIPIAFYLSWNYITDLYQVGGQFQFSQIRPMGVFGIISQNTGATWQYTSYINFMEAIWTRILVMNPIQLTYFQYITVICILISLLIRFIGQDKIMAILLPLIYFLGSMGYALAMLLLYMFSFGEIEGPTLASFDRYMICYLFIGTTLIVMISCYLMNNTERKNRVVSNLVILVVLCFFVNWNSIGDLIPSSEYTGAVTDNTIEVVEKLEHAEEGKRIIIIQQYTWEYGTEIMFKYLLLDSHIYCDFSAFGQDKWFGQLSKELTVEEWVSLLSQYDYLFTLYPDDVFIQSYWQPVFNGEILNRRLYKIIVLNDTHVDFQLIEE